MEDNRFAALFTNPEFEVNEKSSVRMCVVLQLIVTYSSLRNTSYCILLPQRWTRNAKLLRYICGMKVGVLRCACRKKENQLVRVLRRSWREG